jgi:hypothetical protein
MAGKKEGAQRILDAKASAMKVQQRLIPAGLGIVLIGVVVAYLSRWEFGLATVLMCGLLFQYALERMNTIVEASITNGLKDMGWDADTELDDQTMEKIRNIANR